jgi:hypothetical protein
MSHALRWLILRQIAGGTRYRLSRLKNPRYAVPALLGFGYFGLIFFGNMFRPGEAPEARQFREYFHVLLGPAFALLFATTWLFAPARPAPLFTLPDASQLFVMPLSRRQLLNFRLLKAQFAILIISVIAGLLSLRSADVAPWFAAGSAFTLMNLMALNGMAASVVMTRMLNAGWRGVMPALPGIVMLAVLAVVVAINYQPIQFGQTNVLAWAREVFHGGVAATVLWPFHQLAHLPGAAGAADFGRGFAAAMGFAVVLYGMIMLLVSPFEERALALAENVGKVIKAKRGGNWASLALEKRKSLRSTSLKLAAMGKPWVAIFWKNLVAEWRIGTWRVAAVVAVIAVLGVSVARFVGVNKGFWAFVMGMSAAFGMMFTTFVPRLLATGLHLEIRRAPLLKALPIRGHDLLRGTAWAGALLSAIPLGAFATMAGIALSTGIEERFEYGPYAVVGALPLGIAVCGLMIVLESGLVLMVPAWVVTNPGEAGVEAVGRNMLSFLVRFLGGSLLLSVPVGIGVAAGAAIWMAGAKGVAIAVGGWIAAALVALEVELLAHLLGLRFNRMEPGEEG